MGKYINTFNKNSLESTIEIVVGALVLIATNFVVSHLFLSGSVGAFFLAGICCLPIYFIALRHGLLYSSLTTILAGLILLFFKGWFYTFVQMFVFWLPSYIASTLILIDNKIVNTPLPRQGLALGQIIFSSLLAIIVLVLLLMMIINHNASSVAQIKMLITNRIDQLINLSANFNADTSFVSKLYIYKKLIMDNFLLVLSVPCAFYSTIFMLTNLYFGINLTQGYSKRNFLFFWPYDLRLPLLSLIIFIICCIASAFQLPQIYKVVCFSIISSFSIVIFLCGLAYLHFLTLNLKLRYLLLPIIYILLITSALFAPPLSLTIFLMGIWSIIKYFINRKIFI